MWPIIEIVLDEKGMSARAYIIELWIVDQPSLPSSLPFATKLETLALLVQARLNGPGHCQRRTRPLLRCALCHFRI
jgi:hypothetical protein